MPWRARIIDGLLGADVLGFQTKQSARNFSRVARQLTDATGSDTKIEHEGREILCEAHPISIDFQRFDSLANSEEVQEKAHALRNYLGKDRNIILGVDRLDYTKGIDVRLRAVEELFENKLTTAAETVFVQIAVPSREAIDAYEKMREDIELLVGRINGAHADPGRVAVHYLYRSLPQEELVAYYLAADVIVVTPFQDGMNLVVKEYVATRTDNSGVVVLSEFAGAAHELKDALFANPFDIDAVTSSLDQAIRLPEEDAARRMRRMRNHVKKNDVYAWAQGFLTTLGH
jgi:trehalose 6-phosphate synthase